MNLLHWIKGRLSHRGLAMQLYKRGLSKARKHDSAAAIADYTAVIEMTDAPENVRAMALYNRSLVYTANNEGERAVGDLTRLLEMPDAAANIKTEARRKLLRMDRTSERQIKHTRDAPD